MYKLATCLLACCLSFSASALAQQKKVSLKDGGYLIGTVKEEGNNYIVDTEYGTLPVAKDQVLSIKEYLTPDQQYQRRLAKIDKNSATDRFALAQWAFENKMLKIARLELKAALALRPDYERAKLLLRQVEARIAAKTGKPGPAGKPGPIGKPGQPSRLPAWSTLNPSWLVTKDEIAVIRLAELRNDDRVTISFRNNVLNRFIAYSAAYGALDNPAAVADFRRWSRSRQVNYMMADADWQAGQIAKDVVVKGDPRFMVDFRRYVWPVVSRYCASGDCHGGMKAPGGLRLLNVAARTPNIDYTNFLLLDRYQRSGRKMIDRDFRDMSLLLQYGLPRELAQSPHPIPISPVYRNKQSISYRRVMAWIQSLKGPPHPKYDVKLRVPWLAKRQPVATAPAAATTRPAVKPRPLPSSP